MSQAGGDQKKLLVLGVLGVLLLGVGAFQMIGRGTPAPVSEKKSESKEAILEPDANSTNPKGEVQEPDGFVQGFLEPRDPFIPQAGKNAGKSGATPVAGTATPAEGGSTSTTEAVEPPMPGEQFAADPLPDPKSPGHGEPESAPKEPTRPSYQLTGVVTGVEDVALLRDAFGKDRTVVEGQILPTGEKVISISATKVVLKTNEGSFTLKLRN